MTDIKPYDVHVTIEARRLIAESMEIVVPMVTAVDAGEKCSKSRVNQMVREAIDE